MRSYRLNSHSKYDLKVHLIWIPKYRKRVLTGQVAERTEEHEGETVDDGRFQICQGRRSVARADRETRSFMAKNLHVL